MMHPKKCNKVLTSKQMPEEVREAFIYTGYRPMCSSIKYVIKSAFTLHNETLNFWTHVIPFIYFVYYVVWDSEHIKRIDNLPDHHRHPMYGYLLGVFVLFAGSSFAHLFCCAYSQSFWNVCFAIDYAAITMFGSSSAILYHFSLSAEGGAVIKDPMYFLLITFVVSTLAMCACCWTRLRPHPLCNVIRIFSFGLPFLVGSSPAFARVYTHALEGRHPFWRSEDPLPHHPINDFAVRYPRHLALLILGAVINGLKFPERLWPGRFDLIGHSHQWFHVFVFLGIREQFWMIFDDIIHADPEAKDFVLQNSSIIPITLGVLGAQAIAVLVVIAAFAYVLPNKDSGHYGLCSGEVNRNKTCKSSIKSN